jgi:hypothetical protein
MNIFQKYYESIFKNSWTNFRHHEQFLKNLEQFWIIMNQISKIYEPKKIEIWTKNI